MMPNIIFFLINNPLHNKRLSLHSDFQSIASYHERQNNKGANIAMNAGAFCFGN